ncbi:MAG: FAD-dependent monooxygenase [Comamonadaceae bacterium]
MGKQISIVGGGIGGLAAALACSRAGSTIKLFECSQEFTEVGAGIQMGPNVVRVLQAWGLSDAVRSVAAFPERLQVRSATSGTELGALRLGATVVQRYGAPYATIHRADLHALLQTALQCSSEVELNLDSELIAFAQNDSGVKLQTASGRQVESDLLLGADGLWSRVRQELLDDGVPVATGHLAYRAMVPQKVLPVKLRSQHITAWLGPQLHVVQYPVRGGDWLNVVAVVEGDMVGDIEYWDHGANVVKLRRSMAQTCGSLRELIHAIEHWRLWGLSIRPPVRGADELARGRVALLGDAAHPMLPYLAQGAGMAIEDAQTLARVLQDDSLPVPDALRKYANARWQRNARVQARAVRNGHIFHATGLIRWGRDVAMRLLGERLLDVPWLYRGPGTRATAGISG